MIFCFAEGIAKEQAFTCIDDVIIRAKINKNVWKILEFYFKIWGHQDWKPHQSKQYSLWKVQLIGKIVSDKGSQTVAIKFQDLKNLKKTDNEWEVMQNLGSLGFYSTFINNMHVDSKPFY